MAAVASESEQVVDQTNAGILVEEKPADEKIAEEDAKEAGAFLIYEFFSASFDLQIFSVCMEKCKFISTWFISKTSLFMRLSEGSTKSVRFRLKESVNYWNVLWKISNTACKTGFCMYNFAAKCHA